MRKDRYFLPLLGKAIEAYQDLKQENEYKLVYQAYKIIQNKFNQAYKKKDENEYLPLFDLLIEASFAIERRWHLKYPIDPNLNISKEDLLKPIRANSSLAKLIKAFDICPFPQSKKEKSISKQRLGREKRVNKFVVYSMSRMPDITIRELARRSKVNKDTIKNWISEVGNWPEEEKKAVMAEFITSKNLPNIDVLDLPQQNFVSITKIGYGLTPRGPYKTGRKLRPKIPYDKPE